MTPLPDLRPATPRAWLTLALALACGCAAAEHAPPAPLSGFDCLIEPQTVAAIGTREEGILETLEVERGDPVKTGQVIARLNHAVEQANVDLARARAGQTAEIAELEESLAFATREKERIDRLSAVRAISTTEKDKATSEALRARLRLDQALERRALGRLELERALRLLENRTVRSPIDGVVAERLMAPGESVLNRPIVRVATIDPLNVEIIVPIDAFGTLREGMQAEVQPRYPGASPATAKVTVVDRLVDAQSDTFGVRLLLPNPQHAIPGGVRCDIRFLGSTHEPENIVR